ncbi:MAG: hypothetical protein H7320_20360 [Ferruginibacter sp.]|nr:hypothetical protein [Ferruginibacter sp.]
MLTAKHYCPRTIRNYMQEMGFLFAHYCDLLPASMVGKNIIAYINFIVNEHGVGRRKCHQVAQSCSFFFKHVMPPPFVIPSQFYPRKESKLPQVFRVEQIKQLLSVITNPKHRVMIGLDNITAIRIALEWKQGQLLLPEQVEALKRYADFGEFKAVLYPNPNAPKEEWLKLKASKEDLRRYPDIIKLHQLLQQHLNEVAYKQAIDSIKTVSLLHFILLR